MKEQSTRRWTALGLVLASGSLFPLRPSLAAGGAGGFQPYKNATLGFALTKPDGWTVRTEGASIWVESPDKSELLLTELFHAAPGDTAEQWLDKMGDKYGAHFSNADIDSVKPVQGKGNEVGATMHYQGPKGAARLRVLCSIVNGKGLLCVMAAPSARFTVESPKLLHVANSLQFMVPRGTSGAASGGGEGEGVNAASIAAAARQIKWVKWTDPKEGAFSISVPQGWKVEGGTFREQSGSVNFSYNLTSPSKDISMLIGSPVYISFMTPSQMTMSMGWREGTNGVMHYMHAPEFNDFYLRQVVGRQLQGLTSEKGHEEEQISSLLTQQMSQAMGGGAIVSYGVTQFKGTDKDLQKPFSGAILSTTTRTSSPGMNEPIVSWSANPSLIVTQTGDSKDAVRARTALAVFGHVGQTFREDPEWRRQRDQQFNHDIKAKAQQNIANINAIGARARQNAAASSAAEDAIMGRYHSHVAAGNAQQNAFINMIGDRTDVTDSSGHTSNVGSGYSHYYKNDRTGTIMGTNSAYSPGVDFSPMAEN